MIYLLMILSNWAPPIFFRLDFFSTSQNRPMTRRKWKINYCSLFLDFVASQLKSDMMRFNIYIAVSYSSKIDRHIGNIHHNRYLVNGCDYRTSKWWKALLKDKHLYFNRQYWALPPGGKATREWISPLSPSSSRVQNECGLTSTPTIGLFFFSEGQNLL